MGDEAANRRGILAASLACAFWTCTDTFGKLATETFPTGEMMTVRGVFAVAIAAALVVIRPGGRMPWSSLHLLLRPLLVLRAILDAIVVLTFYEGLAYMQLADITAVSQSTPIIITLMAAMLGIERIGWRRLAAILVGFGGVLIVVRPSANGLTVYALLAVVSSVFVAARDLMTRSIDRSIPSTIIALMSAVAGTIAGLMLGVAEHWGPVMVTPTLYLAAAGVLVTIGNLLIVVAYRGAEVGVVAPFRYLSIPLSILFGYLVFGTLPDGISFVGIVLIMGSGIYTIYREQVRRRAERASATGLAADAPAARAGSRRPA